MPAIAATKTVRFTFALLWRSGDGGFHAAGCAAVNRRLRLWQVPQVAVTFSA